MKDGETMEMLDRLVLEADHTARVCLCDKLEEAGKADSAQHLRDGRIGRMRVWLPAQCEVVYFARIPPVAGGLLCPLAATQLESIDMKEVKAVCHNHAQQIEWQHCPNCGCAIR